MGFGISFFAEHDNVFFLILEFHFFIRSYGYFLGGGKTLGIYIIVCFLPLSFLFGIPLDFSGKQGKLSPLKPHGFTPETLKGVAFWRWALLKTLRRRSKKGSVQLRDANNEELIRATWPLHRSAVSR